MQNKTWIVVASSACARIFQIDKGPSLKELETFVHPNSRLHEQDLVSERPGRGHESVGPVSRTIEPKTSAKKHEFIDFSKSLAKHLEIKRVEGAFNRLYIAANPAFLGFLRQAMDKPTMQMIEKEVDKDITHLTAGEIGKYFPPFEYQVK